MYRKFGEIWTCGFYPRDAMLARVLAVIVCPSVHLPVRHTLVLCQNGSRKHRHMIAQGLQQSVDNPLPAEIYAQSDP